MLDDRAPAQPRERQRRRLVGLFAFAPLDRRTGLFFAAGVREGRVAEPDDFFFADECVRVAFDPRFCACVAFFTLGAAFPGDAARVVRAALRALASFRITSGSSRSRHMYQDATDAYGAHRSPMRSTSFGVGSFDRR